jgi:hypothetical protein
MHRSKNLVWKAAPPAGGLSGKPLEGGAFRYTTGSTGLAAETEK